MSFNHYARKVRDPKLNIWLRRSALRSCILRLARLTKQTYQVVLFRFVSRFNLNLHEELKGEQLLDILAAVEAERNFYLERLRAFERRRILEKIQGKRYPSTIDVQAIYREDVKG